MKQKLTAIAEAVLIALVILAGAIAVPILCRPFFYLHIKLLGLADRVGLTIAEAKIAYNEMMDFCMGLTDTFSVGELPWSASAMEHFADVRKLFVLDLCTFAGATLLLIGVCRFGRKKTVRLLGHTSGFWGAIGLGILFLTIGTWAALDFDRAFVVFHQLLFPGKSNWLFDSRKDPIINMLPAEFFRNCAILILVIILVSCCLLIIWDQKSRHKK